MKTAAVLIGSAREKGNSTIIANEFLRGFKENGGEAKIFKLNELKYKGFIGCFSCRKTGYCIHKDDMVSVLESVSAADIVVICSPVFMHQVSGQVKTAIDRLYPLLAGEPGKYSLRFGKKKAVVIYSQGAPFETAFKDMMECNKNSLAGLGLEVVENLIYTGGNTAGSAYKNEEIMQRAYKLGKELALF